MDIVSNIVGQIRYQCSECKSTFSTLPGLKNHIKSHSVDVKSGLGDEDEKKMVEKHAFYTCPVCKEKFTKAEELGKIMNSFNYIFSQHGPEAMMAIAFTRRPSVRPSLSSASTIVEVFETIIATGLKSYEHV